MRAAESPQIAPGESLGPYKVLGLLGAGGMGEVYRALDTRLGREVAVKVLPAVWANEGDRLSRFEQEARAVAALSHPNIVSIHDFGACDGITFAVMELLEGETLGSRLSRGPLPLRTVMGYALQIANGLAAAHKRGIIHRDLKPDNVFLTTDGQVKILDFGLAKLCPALDDDAASQARTASEITGKGAVLGTVGYMSPEQVKGQGADQRSDIFAFGTILYEMASGRRCFRGETTAEIMAAILTLEPTDLGKDFPDSLERIIRHCLEKNPQQRFQSVQDVAFALEESLTAGALSRWTQALRTRVSSSAAHRAAITLGVLAVLGTLGGWFWHRYSRECWVHEWAAPEVGRLVEAGEYTKAAQLVRQARTILPKDPTLERLWLRATATVSINSVPQGADVAIQPYPADSNTWEQLGNTPLEKVRVPRATYLWRISKPGFAPASALNGSFTSLHGGFDDWTATLRAEGTVSPDMVPVLGREVSFLNPYAMSRATVEDFLIDRHEVTNEEYKRFMVAGAYEKREFWKEPFLGDGRTLTWKEAMAVFRDGTGRPGPATWEAGTYPRGLEKHPVAGISWYEAAAYAEFAGKRLPTVYHWQQASQADDFPDLIASGSNFRGQGTWPVGGHGTLSGFGTFDMAGNVKEWAWNEGAGGKRFILGGGFGEPTYRFPQADAQLPWRRLPNYGVRCVKLDSPLTPAAAARIEGSTRDYLKEKPVSDEVFAAYKGLYAYDHRDLRARVEETEGAELWTHEKVTFDAAYGTERVIVHLFLPKNASPPFQAVIYFPSSGAMLDEKFSSSFINDTIDYLPKSGRALVWPIYKSTFERRDGLKPGGQPPGSFRDHVIMISKDLGRCLDYLETRKDIDSTRLAYLGFSWGGYQAPVFLAVDRRFKAAVLSGAGFVLRRDLPEVDSLSFVTRVTTPVLVLNGRYDSYFPLETSELPFFQFLGTPAKDKKHVVYDVGHGSIPRREEIRQTLDWFDKYLGPIRSRH